MNIKHETKAEPLTAGDIFARTYSIPLYQRGYAWGREEIWQLLDDLKEAYDFDHDRNYYIGSLTAFLRTDVSGRQTYELIDGQQRTITLSLLLRLFAQFLPSNIPSFRLSGHLRFENRPDAESFLATFDEHPDEAPTSPAPFRRAVDAMLDHPVFGVEYRESFPEFAKFVRSHAVVFLVTMPPKTDVSAYFEIMNNRGIQLEFHELLKAKLMSRLPDDVDKVLFDLLWTACSRMDGYFTEYLDEKTTTALEKGESWLRLGRDSVKIGNMTVDGGTVRSVIPDFPNFLLHALRVYLNNDISATIPLDERQMRKTFDECLDSIVSEQFLDVLIQTRLRFDRFVIKADGGAEGVEIRWCIEGKNDWMPADRERLIHLQSMLQVSYPTRRNKEWLSRLLCTKVEDASDLIVLLEGFARERLLLKQGEVESLRCLGTGTPHLAFNLIDYLMYCAEPAKYSGAATFRFAYRNSVEHHFPRGSGSENGIWQNDVVNDIGNLYLLSKSDNSSLNVRSPSEKVTLAGRLDNLPPKRRKMYRLTQVKGWTPEVMRHHSDEVLKLIESFLSGNASDRAFAAQGAPISRDTTEGDIKQETEQPFEPVNFRTSIEVSANISRSDFTKKLRDAYLENYSPFEKLWIYNRTTLVFERYQGSDAHGKTITIDVTVLSDGVEATLFMRDGNLADIISFANGYSQLKKLFPEKIEQRLRHPKITYAEVPAFIDSVLAGFRCR